MSPAPPIRHRHSMTRLLRAALPLVVSVVALAACGGSSSTPHVAAASSPSGPAGAARHSSAPPSLTQLLHSAAQCVRAHGIPNFPDPVVDTHGNVQYDDQLIKNLPVAVTQNAEHACASQINAAQSAAAPVQPAATPQEIQQATQFAQCMRQHGWPNFPDPDSHARFQLSNPNDGPATKNDPSFQACRTELAPRGQ
jgi:hypothetical protein